MTYARTAAFYEPLRMLLLGSDIKNYENSKSNLVALNSIDGNVFWSTKVPGGCFGLAVLPDAGIVVASGYSSLFVYRLLDGTCIEACNSIFPMCLAADTASATVYVSNCLGIVTPFRWTGTTLEFLGRVNTEWCVVAHRAGECALVVVPSNPGIGLQTSYLVMGPVNSNVLYVLSLPERRLEYTHCLERGHVCGLSTNPSGTALYVCTIVDEEWREINVFTWPLPQMLMKSRHHL